MAADFIELVVKLKSALYLPTTRDGFQSDGRSAMLNTGCKSSRPRIASARASSFSPARAYRMASRLTMVRITELSSWSMRYLPSVRCSPGPSMTLSWLGLGLGWGWS